MANPFTTLRNEVLKDIGSGSVPTVASVVPAIIESGGGAPAALDPGINRSISIGVDYGGASPSVGVAFPSPGARIDSIDAFLNYVVREAVMGLRVIPTVMGSTSNTQVSVLATGNHPFVFEGALLTYAGSVIDLLSHVPPIPMPDLGTPATASVLLTLLPYITDPTAAVHVITDPTIVANVALWPIEELPLAVIALSSDLIKDPTNFIEYSDILDARPFITGNGRLGVVPTTFVVGAVDSTGKHRADYICDGVDDQEQINAALGALPAWGGEVVLQEGHYSIGDTSAFGRCINIITSNTALRGLGASAILVKKWDETTADHLGVITVGDGGTHAPAYIGISRLAIDGGKSTYTSAGNHGVLFKKLVSHSTIEACAIHDLGGHGVYLLSSPTPGVQNNDNRIEGCDLHDNAGHGIYLYGANEWNLIQDDFCVSNGGCGIKTVSADKNRIDQSTCFSNGSAGVWVESALGATVSRNDATQNASGGFHFFDCRRSGFSDNRSFSNTGDGFYLDSSVGCSLSSNTAWANTGINLHGVGGSLTGGNLHSIVGNSLNDPGAEGMLLDGVSACVVSGNSVTNPASGKYCLRLTAGSDGTLIDSNRFDWSGVAGGAGAIHLDGASNVEIGTNGYAGSGNPILNAGSALDVAARRGIASWTSTAGVNYDTLIEADATSGPLTVNLPGLTSYKGIPIVVQKSDISMNPVTVAPIGRVLASQNDLLIIVSDGSAWRVLFDSTLFLTTSSTTGQVVGYDEFTAGSGGAWDADPATRSGGTHSTVTTSVTPLSIFLVLVGPKALQPGVDYVASGASIAFNDTQKPIIDPDTGLPELVRVVYFKAASNRVQIHQDPTWTSTDRTSAGGAKVSTTLPIVPDALWFVLRTDVALMPGVDFTLTGATVSFPDGAVPIVGETVTVVFFSNGGESAMASQFFAAGDGGPFDAASDRTGGTDPANRFTLGHTPIVMLVFRNHDCLLPAEVDRTTPISPLILTGSRPIGAESVRIVYSHA